MYRNVPQQAYEIQEMTERPSKERNGTASNGSMTKPKGGTPTTSKNERPASDSSENGLLYDDGEEDVDYEVAKGEKIRNTVICVVVLLLVVGAVIALAVTLSGKKGQSNSYDAFHFDQVNYTETVYLNCTPVRGVVEQNVYIFRGIKYASSRRWRESEPLESADDGCYADDILEADSFGQRCYQYNETFGIYVGAEDCLFLNVWTPSLGNESSLPVMVFFHGGGLMVGSGGESGACPNAMVAKETNMVYVSFNYRLNAFGFLSLDIFGKIKNKTQGLQGNFGLQDQIMALNWVQKNIHHFGGDPEKVTVFGQGSGATSILALMTVPETKGLYHRAWLMSPSPKLEGNTRNDVKEQNILFLNNTRCPVDSENDKEMLNCLEDTPGPNLLRALPWSKWLNTHYRTIPKVDEESTILAIIDEKLVTKSVIDALKQRTAVDVPLLIGNMAQEVDDEVTPKNLSQWDWMEYNNYIKSLPLNQEDYKTLTEYYPQSLDLTPEYQLTSMVSDMRAICPMNEVTKVAASNLQSSVYRYVMTYRSLKQLHSNTKNYAFSGLDMYAFFGSYDKISVQDSKLTSNMRKIVSDFARDGQIKDSNWGTFPQVTTVITNIHSISQSGYKNEECKFWRVNGLFPRYAWMN